MAKRHLARRGHKVAAPVRKPVEPEEIDDLEEEIEDEEDEEEVETVAPRRVARKVIGEDIADEEDEEDEDEEDDEEDEEDEEYEDEEEEEVPPVKVKAAKAAPPVKAAKVAKVVPPAKVAKAVPPKAAAKVTAPVTKASIKTVEQTVADSIFESLLTAMTDGKAIVITRVGDKKWQMVAGDAVVTKRGGLVGKAYWDEVISPEARAWSDKWGEMTFEQKKAYAKKIGAKWDAHEDERIAVMRITQAVRTKEGIEKYKPEYRTRAARAALAGK